ncbi:MAG: hypothetical protein AAF439_01075 [Pseudomonadota bacterium]
MADITGDSGANVLIGTPGDDLIKGKGGADIIDGGAGNDKLKGGNGGDIITDGAGADKMWGGKGADTFVLVAGDGERDKIRDWESQDTIDLSAWGVHDISELTFTTLNNGQIRIIYGDEELQIKQKGGGALTEADFTASHFIFEAAPVYRTIDFEALDSPVNPYGNAIATDFQGYEGLTWSSTFYFAEHDELVADGIPSGIDNGTISGDNVGINGFGSDVSFSAADSFDFEQMSVGSLYLEGMTLEVTGKEDGVVTGTQTIILSTQSTSVIELDDAIFNDVDTIEFATSGGTIHPDYASLPISGDLTMFYIDDMIIG